MSYSTQQIRNVALAGHPGAGKTTLFEALLHAGGALQVAGTIERGTTVSDHDPLEKSRGHSIDTAIASTDHGGMHVNLIDTPGYPEFRGPALSALSAVETALIVVDADQGVAHGTRRLMERAAQRHLCRAIVINKIDHEGADCAGVLAALRDSDAVEDHDLGRAARLCLTPRATQMPAPPEQEAPPEPPPDPPEEAPSEDDPPPEPPPAAARHRPEAAAAPLPHPSACVPRCGRPATPHRLPSAEV